MKKKTKNFIKEGVALACFIALIIFWRMTFTSILVSGHSMDNTLRDGLIGISLNVNENSEINRGDIVVVNEGDYYVIKRIVGMPGETIKCAGGNIYIDDVLYEESYTSSPTEDFEEVQIGEGEYFIMGDNRSNSKDSRDYGAIKKSQIKSKGVFVINSLTYGGIRK